MNSNISNNCVNGKQLDVETFYNMFDLSNHCGDLKVFDKIKIVNGKMMSEQMQPILIEDGFLFPPNPSIVY